MEQSILNAASLATERLGQALNIKLESQEDNDFLEGYNKGYCHGAEWQKEQDKELLTALKQIACWPGNLDDTRLTSKTGANDAVARGLLVVHMRTVALLAIKKIEPDYEPFK